ncbi:hypothetical protein E4P40_10650 [Blastococcus sp. CT_GayMR20]|uniref:hypothetical protein n=1 Tax=Blastococcus sp. CT_GayMR20 TaxID=2559609 RepID=UPI0010748E2E|nr:hypothetical protein [Blastococcus sp. CT_GayMR20]TFV88079.1 hypothetical protein E4P40_10650 [Blastococcus sp. CT_GayMR20]
MAPFDADLEGRLRDLRVRADDLAPAPADLVRAVRARHRRQRRTQLRFAAAGLAVALLFIGVPVIASTLDAQRSETAKPAEETPGRAERALYGQPPRGSLADDEEWLAGIAARKLVPADPAEESSTSPVSEESIDVRATAFAGDVPGARVALVVARLRDDRVVQAWFTGPTGAEPEEMTLTELDDAPRTGPLALLDIPDPVRGEAVLVVAAFPGDAAEVMTGHVVTASGEIRERWEQVPIDDGAGWLGLDLPVVWLQNSTQLRIGPGGEDWERISPRLTERTAAAEDPGLLGLADPRGLRGAVDEFQLRTAVRHLVSAFGSHPDELGLTLLAGGRVDGLPANSLLVGATFASGATMGFVVVYPDDLGNPSMATTYQSQTATGVAPAGTALLDRVFAVELAEVVTVSGPGSGMRAEIYDAEGVPLTTVPLVAGAGAGALPPQTPSVVRIFDGSGALVAEAPVTQPGE